MSRLFTSTHGRGFDLLIVIAALVGALEVALGGETLSAPQWFAVLAVAIVVLPLLGRRRFPFASPVAVWVLAAGLSFIDGELVVSTPSLYVAGLAASFELGSLTDADERRWGLAVTLAAIWIVVYNAPAHDAGDFIFTPGLMAIAWLVGLTMHERARQADEAQQRAVQAEREREEGARRAVFEERVRIARELHDVVAHHVSMMGVQAGAARMVIDRDPPKAKAALAAIEASSRQAVDELHRLLGFLRQAGEADELTPTPGMSQLRSLAAGMSDSDLAVEVDVEGEERPLPPTVDVSAYRIVQEALTNTLKHAGASHANVRLRYVPGALEVEIVDDGRGDGAPSADGTGLGLIGMRERAALHGGTLEAGPLPGRGFAVRVNLPTRDGAR